nr:hypothetical protein CFP56_08694 [Quercus suber]
MLETREEVKKEVRSQSTAMHATVGGHDVQASQQSGDFMIQAEVPPSSETSTNNNMPTVSHNNNIDNPVQKSSRHRVYGPRNEIYAGKNGEAAPETMAIIRGGKE